MSPRVLESIALGVGLMTLTQALCVAAMFGVPVLAPAIAAEVGADVALISIFLAILYAVSMAASAAGGAAAARHGAFAVSIACLALCAAGALASASGTWTGLALATLAFGTAAGAETPASAHLLSRLVPAHRRARMFSIRQTGNQIGAITASLLLPALAATLGWRGGLIVLSALCAGGGVLLVAMRHRFPCSDAAVAARRPRALDSLRVVWSVPPLRNMSLAASAFCGMQICLNGLMTTYATSDLGMPLAAAGVLLAVAQTGGLIARFGMGFMVERVGATRPVMFVLGLTMSFAAALTASFGLGWSWPAMVTVVALFGVSASGWDGIFYAEAARLAPEGRAAEAAGGAQFIAYAGLIAGPLLFGLVAKTAGNLGAAYLALSALTLAGSLCLLCSSGKKSDHLKLQ
jgi:MFS family permease